MATPDQQSIDTFMSVTGASEPVAIQKLSEHGGSLNKAVNSYFTSGDANIQHETHVAASHEDFMDIDETHGGVHDSHHLETVSRTDYVTNTLPEVVSETCVTCGSDDDALGGISHDTCVSLSAPEISNLPDYGIEEEMIQAAIEASKREAEAGRPDDVSAEQEKASGELESEAGSSETWASKLAEVKEVRTLVPPNGRSGVGTSSIQDETEDADEQPLVRHRSRRVMSSPTRPTQQQNVNNPDEVFL